MDHPDPDPNVSPTDADEQADETDNSPEGEVDNQETEETDPKAEGTADEKPEGEPEEAAPEAEEPESEESPDTDTELDDDTIEALAEVYGDRLLSTKKLSAANQKAIREEVSKAVSSAARTREVEGENATVVEKGRRAVASFTQKVENIQAELGKAGKGESFDGAIADGEELGTWMKEFGEAVLAGTEGKHERVIQDGFNKVLADDLPELSDEQAEKLEGITNNWNRMKQDPQQATEASAYLVTQLWEFAIPLAKAAGAQEERGRATKGKTVKERIAGKNAVAAAKAALEKGKAPPKSPGSTPKGRPGATIEDYERLMDEGKPDEAQAVVDAMEKAARR